MRFLLIAPVLLIASSVWAGSTSIAPTTTLTAETGNNTSASSAFATQSNGNLGATNVSKVAISTALPLGPTTPVYAHFMGWFGQSNHMNVGYTSDDPAQIQRQVSDALSRGISGFILDWYGPYNAMPNSTLLRLKAEAESRSGAFTFAVTYDGGALSACHSTAGCDLTQQAISDLKWAYQNAEQSPAYMRISGRPVVMFFAPDRYGTLNWSLIQSSIPGNPLFIFQNNGGFSHSASSGSFSWIQINTSNANDWSQAYLDSFYSTALTYPAEFPYLTGYKGFNDSLASWGANRVMNQNCGQTWLNTLHETAKFTSNSAAGVQLVTWNDYEEGSEIETGIDGCTAVSASVSRSVLSWWLSAGNASMIDHYTIFISTDGQNLMSLGNKPASTASLDLSTLNLGRGTYTLFVKAVGKPSITNHLSGPVKF